MQAYNPKAYWNSKLKDAAHCLRFFKLKHIDGQPLHSPSLDSEFGTAMHLACNEVLHGGDGVELFHIYWDSVKGKPLKQFKFDWKSLSQMGPIFIKRFKKLHAPHIKVFQAENRLFSTVGEHEAEGTPDVLGDYKGIPSVLDFKTSSARYSEEMIISDVQMPSYAHYAKTELGYTAKQIVFIVFIKSFSDPSIQVLKRELTNTMINSTLSTMQEQIADLEGRKDFPKNPYACVKGPIICPAFHICHGKKE